MSFQLARIAPALGRRGTPCGELEMAASGSLAEDLIALHGHRAVDVIVAQITDAIRRSDDEAVIGLDRTLRQIEATLSGRRTTH